MNIRASAYLAEAFVLQCSENCSDYAGITTPTVDVETSPGVPETLARVQPVTDGGVGSSAIVEIRIAVRPAGLITPIGVAPPSPPVHVDPANPARVAALKRGSVNECHQLLAKSAWP